MTIAELATILTGNTTYEDFTHMPPSAAQTLAQKMTQALSTLFSLAPDHYRRASYSPLLGPAVAGTIAVTQGSAAVTITSPGVNLTGKTIDYGEQWSNDILNETTLLSPVTRASGTYPCTIYDNAILFDRDIRRVVSNPRLNRGGNHQTELYRSECETWISSGMPSSWRLIYPGVVLGSALAAIMKIYPAPTDYVRLTVEVEHESPTYQVPDLQSANRIPLPDEIANAILVPLAEGLLARTRLWSDKTLVSAVLNAEQMALQAIALLPTQTAPIRAYVGTDYFH